jgi:glycosyltransferase involved in cell wall biosynthesis
VPCPTYPEIRLALWPRRALGRALDELAPDAIHVATEGPLGMAAASYCAARGLAFTLVATERQRREFVAHKFGVELAQCLSSADVLVFPSRTDTFGLVMLESMACGTPVAAYPVTGPIDVVAPGVTGVLDDDLGKAALAALRLDRAACRRVACGKTWELASERFLSHLVRASDGSDL